MRSGIGPLGLWATIGAALIILFGIFIDDALLAAGSWASTTAKDPLTVTLRDPAAGMITSEPPGIRCGGGETICTFSFPRRTDVELRATPAPGYRFDGWGGICEGAARCVVQMRLSKTVSASFTRVYHLTVTVTGPGAVRDSSANIDCGASCSASYAVDAAVTLYPAPAPGSRFAGWTGACSGTGVCTLRMDSDKTAAAAFISRE